MGKSRTFGGVPECGNGERRDGEVGLLGGGHEGMVEKVQGRYVDGEETEQLVERRYV